MCQICEIPIGDTVDGTTTDSFCNSCGSTIAIFNFRGVYRGITVFKGELRHHFEVIEVCPHCGSIFNNFYARCGDDSYSIEIPVYCENIQDSQTS